MKKYFYSCALFLTSIASAQYTAERNAVLALGSLTAAPKVYANDTSSTLRAIATGSVQTIYYEALDYNGNATRVYALVGIPSESSASSPAPAVVLLNGGGGAPTEGWVEKWMDRGYAAINIALEGQISVRGSDGKWLQHAMPGPARSGNYGDTTEDLENQWMYHAVANTVLANSLMRSLPSVDDNEVGLMGISWGGVVASTVMGVDDRFSFVIPTYGCGDFSNSDTYLSSLGSRREFYDEVWDPLLRMNRASMPALWISWPTDVHFPLKNQAATYKAMSGDYAVSLILGLGHGEIKPTEVNDSYAFADSVVATGEPWAQQISNTRSGMNVSAVFSSTETINKVRLFSTKSTGASSTWIWSESAGPNISLKSHSNGTATVSDLLPTGTTAYYLAIYSGDLIACSDYEEVSVSSGSSMLQAEDYSGISSCSVRSSNAGYNGSGYVDMGGKGSNFEWDNVAGGNANTTLVFRYALGGSATRACSVRINGHIIGYVQFTSTGGWSQWGVATIDAYLPNGNNTVNVKASTRTGGPNIDELAIGLEEAGLDEINMEAEDASRVSGSSFNSTHAGYSGSGYVDMGGRNSYFEWDDARGLGGISTILNFTYANGSNNARPCFIYVNGVNAGTINFSSTGRWSSWGVETLDVILPAGLNDIRVQASTSSGGPNVDKLEY